MQKYVDSITLILNLMKESEMKYISINKFRSLLDYIYHELRRWLFLDKYRISYYVSIYSISETVTYNHNIIGIDLDNENVYLREGQSLDKLVTQFKLDDVILGMVKEFAKK